MVYVEFLLNGLKTTCIIVVSLLRLTILNPVMKPLFVACQKDQLWVHYYFNLLYINDLPNCSNKLSFRIFADDTNFSKARDNNDHLCKDVDLLDFHIRDKQTSCNLTSDKFHWYEITSNEIHGSDNIYFNSTV